MEKHNNTIISDQEKLSKIMDSLVIADLDLYQEMGDAALKNGSANEGLSWYSKGLAMARLLNRNDKVSLFENLIITYL